jgi:hypothetical protein
MAVNQVVIEQKAAGVGALMFFVTVALVLLEGWRLRGDYLIDAEHGMGYALGIIGGVMMVSLLIYPLRKRNPGLKFLGSIKHWFRIHMMLGVMGPSAILLHCNFGLGALNSNVALWSMVVVASSGLLGRYFYSKIHYGLYGRQATLHELQQESAWTLEQLTTELSYLPTLKQHLENYEKAALAAGGSVLSVVTIPWFAFTSGFAYGRLWRMSKQAIRHEVHEKALQKQVLRHTQENLRTYFRTVRKVAEFGFYTRLFSLWHVLHLPLFAMMLITGIVHVIAVHMY